MSRLSDDGIAIPCLAKVVREILRYGAFPILAELCEYYKCVVLLMSRHICRNSASLQLVGILDRDLPAFISPDQRHFYTHCFPGINDLAYANVPQ